MEKLIADALIDLLDTFAYKDISVRVICEVVPVSRPTFYKHFRNKDDVVRWFVRDDFMKNCFPVFQYHLKEKGVQTYFHYLKKHRNFYIRILDYDNGLFLKDCLEYAYLNAFKYLEEFSLPVTKKKGSINPEIFMLYSVGGISSVIVSWIRQHMEPSEEKMAADLYLMMEKPMGYVRDYYLQPENDRKGQCQT